MKRSNELAHLRQLCNLELPAPALMPALLRSLRAAVPCDSAAFFWLDERGDIQNMYAERMLPPETTRRYFERYYEQTITFRDQLMQRARRGEFVSETVVEGALECSEYYREILQPLEVHRILHAIVHDDRRLLGQLSLYRGRRGARFSPDDSGVVDAAARYIAPLLADRTGRARKKLVGDWLDSDLAAMVVCSTDGVVQRASHRAHALLAHASGEPVNRATVSGSLERAGRALLKKAVAGGGAKGSDEKPAESSTDNEWGRYCLRVYGLGDGDFGVLIQRQEHFLVRIADAMRGHALSAQQREAALWLAQGKTNSEVAKAMGLSINTASYHVKQLFQKLDAHDRAEAISRILDGHTARRS